MTANTRLFLSCFNALFLAKAPVALAQECPTPGSCYPTDDNEADGLPPRNEDGGSGGSGKDIADGFPLELGGRAAVILDALLRTLTGPFFPSVATA